MSAYHFWLLAEDNEDGRRTWAHNPESDVGSTLPKAAPSRDPCLPTESTTVSPGHARGKLKKEGYRQPCEQTERIECERKPTSQRLRQRVRAEANESTPPPTPPIFSPIGATSRTNGGKGAPMGLMREGEIVMPTVPHMSDLNFGWDGNRKSEIPLSAPSTW